jgi:membrane protease YdiL (CAAX protease family)
MTSLSAASSPSLSAPSEQGVPPPTVSGVRLWMALMGLAVLGLVVSVPFLLPVLETMVAGRHLPLSLGVVLLLQDVQVLVLAAVAAGVGVWTAGRVGLDAPLLKARLAGQPVGRRLLGLLPDAVLAGTLGAGLILLLSLAFKSRLPPGVGEFPQMSPWRTATAAAYGGLVEEILCRWGLLSLFAYGLQRLGVSRGTGFWAANVAAALAFGALHLPAAFQLGMPRTPLVVGYLLSANAVVALLCGWLFRRRGLESAMLAHASADLWLHTAFPLLGL